MLLRKQSLLERLSTEHASPCRFYFFPAVCPSLIKMSPVTDLTPYLLCPSTHAAFLPDFSSIGQYLVYFLLFDFSVTHIRSAMKGNSPTKLVLHIISVLLETT